MSDNIYIPPQNKSILDKGIDYGVKGGLILGGVLVLRKLYHDYLKGQEEKNIDKTPETRQAMSLRSGMNPSGMSWMKSFDGTNLTQIFQTAAEIKDIDKVRESYKNLYNDDLWDDLRSELSPSEFDRFTKTVQFNKAKKEGKPLNISQSKEMTKGWVVTEKNVTMRRSPLAIGTAQHFSVRDLIPGVINYDLYRWFADKYKGTNIIAMAPANVQIGYYNATNDDQGLDETNNIHFIRVIAAYPDTNKTGRTVSFWVARSNVKTVSTINEALLYKKFYVEQSAFAGLNGIVEYVYAQMPTVVMNENFKPVGMAKQGMMIGISAKDKFTFTNGSSFLKIKTAEGNFRWVNEKQITIG